MSGKGRMRRRGGAGGTRPAVELLRCKAALLSLNVDTSWEVDPQSPFFASFLHQIFFHLSPLATFYSFFVSSFLFLVLSSTSQAMQTDNVCVCFQAFGGLLVHPLEADWCRQMNVAVQRGECLMGPTVNIWWEWENERVIYGKRKM